MKIARTPTASERHVAWWNVKLSEPFVGAMKIARTPGF